MDETRYRAAESAFWRSVGPAPVERRIPLERTGTTVRILEVGDGPPVLFVHGASSSASTWAPLVAHLDRFRCLLLDRPGCGLSDPLPAPPAADDLPGFAASLVIDVLDALDVGSAGVVSTSLGGYLALNAALAHPDRIGRIVNLGWTVGAPIERLAFVMRLAAVPGLGRLFAAVPPTEGAVRAMLRQIGLRRALEEGRVAQEMIDWFRSLLRDTDTMRNEITSGPRIMTPLRGLDDRVLITEELRARITTPSYFLWGEEDPFGGPAVARRFVAPMPAGEVELVPGAGHAVWLDDPERTAKAITSFLAA